MEIESEAWFPSAAVKSVTDSSDPAPLGFSSHVLHVRWDSLPMLLPDGDLKSIEWWNAQSATWGEWLSGKPQSVQSNSSGWTVEFDHHVAQVLPIDEDGHGRRLAQLNSKELHAAIGGVQHEGRDVILVFEKINFEPLPLDAKHLQMAGESLGRFHIVCGGNIATPNDERSWNQRLEILEPRTRSATKWRAPHSADTQGTITHRNFSLEQCFIHDGNILIGRCWGGIQDALFPQTSLLPAIRDVASAVTVLSTELKRTFCDAWSSTAPAHWSSNKALDGHKGGLLIWEYEQHLLLRMLHQSWGENEPQSVTEFLTEVSTIQNGMYRSRTIAAGAMICLSIPAVAVLYWLFYPDASSPTTVEMAGVAITGVIGGFLRRLYRSLAPTPW
ncbi:MAG: hypothetical protein VX828_03535 [Candidatus Thermoplasmatota archaeon]|nr:hypothetical protein [Candidatus Thermoplasmatota archaeon]